MRHRMPQIVRNLSYFLLDSDHILHHLHHKLPLRLSNLWVVSERYREVRGIAIILDYVYLNTVQNNQVIHIHGDLAIGLWSSPRDRWRLPEERAELVSEKIHGQRNYYDCDENVE